MHKFLAIDLGASSGRAMLGMLDNKKITLEEIHRFSNDPVEILGSFYWDTTRLFFEIKTALIKCKQQGHSDLCSIAVDTWGVDYTLLDKNGRPISMPYHYRDSRTEGMVDKLCEVISKEELYKITGIQFMNLNTIYQLYAASKNDAHILQNAETLLFTPDLLNYYLSGEKACEYSIASTSALLDAKKREFSDELLNRIGIKKSLFPKIVPSGTKIGVLTEELSKETGLPRIPVLTTASHDTASALACVPALTDNFAFLSSGTWSLIGMEIDEPIINEESERMCFTNEGGASNKIKFLKNIMGMWLIQECKRHFEKIGTPYTYDELDKMAQEEEAFVCFINPDDDLFVAPKDMPARIKKYCERTGQIVPDTDGKVIRCIYDSLAMKYKEMFSNMEKLRGREFDVLQIVGGGIKNIPLCQYTADAIGKKVITGPIEATAMGNILVQAMGLGLIKDLKEAREISKNSVETTEYIPKDTKVWNDAYERYLKVTR